MNNKQLYEDTFDSIEMSEEALKKVKDISNNNKKKPRKPGVRIAGTVAAAVLIFAVGNGVIYAATGSAPIAQMINMVMERVNGDKEDEFVMTGELEPEPTASVYYGKDDGFGDDANENKDGENHEKKSTDKGNDRKARNNSKSRQDNNSSVRDKVDSGDGDTGDIETDSQILNREDSSIISKADPNKENTETENTDISAEIRAEGDKIFLVIGEESFDITKDFSDGNAEGEVKIRGVIYKYSVTGTVEKNSIKITRK